MSSLPIQSATIRPDGRTLELVFTSPGLPPSYAGPDPAFGIGGVALSSGAPLLYLGCEARDGDLAIDMDLAWDAPQGSSPGSSGSPTFGALPVGPYRMSPVRYNASGAVVSRGANCRFMQNFQDEVPRIDQMLGTSYPYGSVTELYMTMPGVDDGTDATLKLYKRLTYQAANPTSSTIGVSDVAAPSVGRLTNGYLPLDIPTWLDSTKTPPPFTGLTWTARYYITDPTQLVALTATGLMVSGPANALGDCHLNQTAAFSGVPVTNYSLVDATGFTAPSLSAGTTANIYCAANGLDTNPGTLSQPVLTVQKALALVFALGATPVHGALRFRRGDTISLTAQAGGIRVNGIDPLHPFVFEDYWNIADGPDPGTPPTLVAFAGLNGSMFNFNNCSQFILFRRLAMTSLFSNTTAQAIANTNLYIANAIEFDVGNWITLDDLSLWNWLDGVVVQNTSTINFATAEGVGDFAWDVSILRCRIYDNHGQGFFSTVLGRCLVSQCYIDNNGYTDTAMTVFSTFNHNIYYSNSSYGLTLVGTYLGRSAQDAAQLRSGGIMGCCICDANAGGGFIAGIGGCYGFNVFTKSAASNQTQGVKLQPGNGNGGFGFTVGHGQERHTVNDALLMGAHNNVFANLATGGTGPAIYAVTFSSQVATPSNFNAGYARNNTAVNSGSSVYHSYAPTVAPGFVGVSGNLTDSRTLPAYTDQFGMPSWGWLTAGEDAFIGAAVKGLWTSTNQALFGASASWQSRTGTEADSVNPATATYPNGTADLGSWMASVGLGATDADYRALLRARPVGTWGAAYETKPVYDYFVSSYTPASLAAYGAGAAVSFLGSSGGSGSGPSGLIYPFRPWRFGAGAGSGPGVSGGTPHLIYPFRPDRFSLLTPAAGGVTHLIYPFRPARYGTSAASAIAAGTHLIYPFHPWRFGTPAAQVIVGPSIVAAGPAEIMLAMQTTIRAAGFIDATRVALSLERESFRYRGNQVLILPGDQEEDGPVVQGGGRRVQLYRGRFTVRYVGRCLRDAPGEDTFRLTQPFAGPNGDVGLLPMARNILNVLKTRFVIDAAGDYLTVEPLSSGRIGVPSSFGDALEWAGVDVSFDAAYLMGVDAAADE